MYPYEYTGSRGNRFQENIWIRRIYAFIYQKIIFILSNLVWYPHSNYKLKFFYLKQEQSFFHIMLLV